MAFLRRLRDMGYALFSLVHLLACVLADTQIVLDRKLFPSALTEPLDHYVKTYKDPFILTPPVWFKPLIWMELLFQLPFLFAAVFGHLAGARWMRTPTLIYSTSVVVMAVPMISYILQENFAGKTGPKTTDERMPLVALYGGFLMTALVMLIDFAFLRPDLSYSASQARLPSSKDKKRN